MTNFSFLLCTRRDQALREAADAARSAHTLHDVASALHTSLRTLQRLIAIDAELAHVVRAATQRERRRAIAARVRAARASGARFTLARVNALWLISRYDRDGEMHVARKDKVDAWTQII